MPPPAPLQNFVPWGRSVCCHLRLCQDRQRNSEDVDGGMEIESVCNHLLSLVTNTSIFLNYMCPQIETPTQLVQTSKTLPSNNNLQLDNLTTTINSMTTTTLSYMYFRTTTPLSLSPSISLLLPLSSISLPPPGK